MRPVGFRGDEEPAGILVEPVDDAGPHDAADARQRGAAVGDEGIDQRAGGVAGRRMHGEALGLVDDDEVRVFVDDGERDRLRLGLGGRGRRHAHDIDLAGFHLAAEIVLHLAVAAHRSGADQRLQACPAEIRQVPHQETVQALARRGRHGGQHLGIAVFAGLLAHGKSVPALIARPASLIDVARRARPVRLAVRTSASHVENSGSIPLRGANLSQTRCKITAQLFRMLPREASACAGAPYARGIIRNGAAAAQPAPTGPLLSSRVPESGGRR